MESPNNQSFQSAYQGRRLFITDVDDNRIDNSVGPAEAAQMQPSVIQPVSVPP